jgi:hypothetical protein
MKKGQKERGKEQGPKANDRMVAALEENNKLRFLLQKQEEVNRKCTTR